MRKIDLTNFQVATSETARDINRRIMLNLIRRHQPISRADLARQSGLQRSTVSAIAEQLLRQRWITEGASGRVPRGRRPRFLHLNQERVGIIGINVRPLRTTVAIANLEAQFVAQESLPTASEPSEFLAQLSALVRSMMAANRGISYEGIGVSLPGRIDLASQRLVFAPNLGWTDVDLKTPLEQATGLPVELENAANACALSTLWFGRHEGLRNLVAVTVSEGIGAGVILNGQLVRGTTGMAGEFGHVTLIEDGLPCRCGNRGCWELYASNTAVIREYVQATTGQAASGRAASGRAETGQAATGHAATAQSGLARGRGKSKPGADAAAQPPTIEDVMQLAEQGDPAALAAVDRMAHYLGVGTAQLVTGLAPDIIVIVGEITRLWPRIGGTIERIVQSRSFTHARTRIVPTDPDAQPRLRGTIALVLQKHFSAPNVVG